MENYLALSCIALLILCISSQAVASTASGELRYKDDFLTLLVKDVPNILKDQDPKTGRFGEGIWIVNDQHPMYPLAVAWATRSDKNPYYHDSKVLEAIMAAGDALIEDQAPDGQWEFRKKDGSTWGPIYQPWTYSRWIRAYSLIKDGMPADRRKKWEDGLILGFTGIEKKYLGKVHNIPTHQAMGLYIAGKSLDRPDWCEKAKAFMAKVVGEQDSAGFWSEHYGPVVAYNFVYSDALGTYYAVSGDKTVLPALKRTALFHANFTYPNGHKVETIDERNPYHAGVSFPNVGFTYSAEGRGYILQQMEILKKRQLPINSDALASFLLYGEEGPAVPTAAGDPDRKYVQGDGKAMVRRKGAWYVCVSAYCCPVPENRWIQDRQNFVSVYNDRCGLIMGGGNTKLQPLWSNFTVGDPSLLSHKAGDTNPNFKPASGIVHVPESASLLDGPNPGIKMQYAGENCELKVELQDDSTAVIRVKAAVTTDQPVAAHLTFIPHIGQPLKTGNGQEKVLGDEKVRFSGKDAGGWVEHGGWKVTLPEESQITWPVLPHNPYRKDGSAEAGESRIVVSLPFSKEKPAYVLTLTVTKPE